MLVLALPLLLPQSPAAGREERVLELVRELQRQGSWHYSRAFFESAPPPLGRRPIVVAEVFLFCGNSDEGSVEGARVRRAALQMCSIYGLAAEPLRLAVDGENSVVLDGLDPARKVGFDLRGFDDLDWSSEASLEESSIALDEGELAWLDTQGYRVFVADIVRFRKLDGDSFTGTLGCLSGLVAFLNEVTEGEDVALGGLLFEREATWPLFDADLPMPDGIRRWSESNERRFVVERPAKLTIACRGQLDFGPPIGRVFLGQAGQVEREVRLRFPSSTGGAPSVLNLCGGAFPLDGGSSGHRPSFLLRIRQHLGDAELVHETDSFTLFLPGSFDLAQPFELDLELAPGRYTFWGPARLGAAAPR